MTFKIKIREVKSMKSLKKTLSLLTAAAMLAASLTACGGNEENVPTTESQTTLMADVTENNSDISDPMEADVTEADPAETGEIKTLYSPNFSIELMGNGVKKVTDGDGRELILVPRSLDEIPAEYSDSIVIRTPAENAVFLSATQVCTFRTVDSPEIISGIGGVAGSADEWRDIPAVAAGIESGDIINVGGDGMTDPDYELIQALEPDVVFVYSGEYGQQSQMSKLTELGINYAVDNEYLESDYLARMEWMRFLLTFFDADDEADAAMANVQANIDEAKAKIEGLDKPVAAIFNIWDGTVFPTDDSSWVGSMAADMGAVNAFSGLPSGAVTYEAAYECISNADIIIYSAASGYTSGMEGIADAFPQITECKAYENNRIYQYTDIFWHGIDQSDIMACNFAAAFYLEVFDDNEFSYLIHIEK